MIMAVTSNKDAEQGITTGAIEKLQEQQEEVAILSPG